jgi:hypothetical protein
MPDPEEPKNLEQLHAELRLARSRCREATEAASSARIRESELERELETAEKELVAAFRRCIGREVTLGDPLRKGR